VKKLPNFDIASKRFLCSLDRYPHREDTARELVSLVKANGMVKYYREICEEFKLEFDNAWVEEATKTNQTKLKELEEKIEDAVKNLGETEVRDSHHAKAEFLTSIGEKDAAISSFRVTAEKTVGVGQRLDIVFTMTRIGFFYNDKELIKRNLDKAKSMIEEGGDWDRKNRLKVYEAYYLMSIRQFANSAKLFIDTLATFNSEELFSYEKNVFYTVITSIVCLERVALKEKVIDSPEVLTVINQILSKGTSINISSSSGGGGSSHLSDMLNSFYNSDYKTFFLSLAAVTDSMYLESYLAEHVNYFAREMRIRAYQQYLQSYRSVQIQSMANAFGVTVQYIDKELSRFIALSRLDCKIDAVGGVVETIRADTKNAHYHNTIKQGDLLLNRVQKLSRVIHL